MSTKKKNTIVMRNIVYTTLAMFKVTTFVGLDLCDTSTLTLCFFKTYFFYILYVCVSAFGAGYGNRIEDGVTSMRYEPHILD